MMKVCVLSEGSGGCMVVCQLVKLFFFFFFQAEDGIRDHCVTGVQTCALPISFYQFLKYICN